METFRIGNLNIALAGMEIPIEVDNLTERFLCPEAEPDISYHLVEMEPEGFRRAERLRYTGGHELLRREGRLFLMNHWARCRFGYGLWMDDLKAQGPVPLYCNPKMREQIPIAAARLLSTIGLHSKLLQAGGGVIHASYIEYAGRAILFTAPSGTGKSTQAELWREHCGAGIINGDRVLVRQVDGVWMAFGYPCCGSSSICLNKTLPIAAIVVLRQGAENKVEPLSPASQIRALASATEVYLWEQRELELAFQLAAQVAAQVPVMQLTCRPDGEAAAVLRNFLEEHDYVQRI